MRIIRCKPYHRPRSSTAPGNLSRFAKSRCPDWAADSDLQQRLIDEALAEPEGPMDRLGRPKRIWNALAGWCFVGVSTNEQEPAYNCYPSQPSTALHEELARRRQRTIDMFTSGGKGDE
jgi:hypothetical protein